MCFLVCLRISSRYFSLSLFKLSSKSTNIDPPLAWILSFIHDVHLAYTAFNFQSKFDFLSLSNFTASSTLSNHFSLSLFLSLVRFKRFWYPYPPLFNLFIHLDFPPLQIFSFPFSLLSFSLPTFLTKSLSTSLPNQPRRNINLWKYCGTHRKPKPKLRNRRRFLSQVPWTVSSFPYSWYCPTKLFSFYIEWTAKISWIQFGPSRYIAIIFVPFLSLFFFFFLDEWKIELQFRNYRIYREDRFYVSVLRLT